MKVIIVTAIEEELPTLRFAPNVFFTGVGKVNATHAMTRLIEEHDPNLVINYGTAGSLNPELNILPDRIVECTTFIERDMNCTALGFKMYETPFEYDSEWKGSGEGIVCGTGDTFVTNSRNSILPIDGIDVVDMEAYALAKVCRNYDVPFRCFKFISDGADTKASDDWKNFPAEEAEKMFKEILTSIDVML